MLDPAGISVFFLDAHPHLMDKKICMGDLAYIYSDQIYEYI